MTTAKNYPLISVIIPVFNVEKYLSNCLDSLIAQTYPNYELIVINDGSTDSSKDICLKYKKLHPDKIILKHQKNAGLSAARNAGLALSKGKYVAFVDSDDTVKPDFLSELYSALKKASADISVCGYNSDIPTPKVLTGKQATLRLFTKQENLDVITWNKLYKLSIFRNNDIAFPVGEIHEDNLTTYKLLSLARSVVYLDKSLYNYRSRSGSITANKNVEARLSQREKANSEASAFLPKSDPEYNSALAVSELLAKLAWLDASLLGKVSTPRATSALAWIKQNSSALKSNPFLTQKLRLYLFLLGSPRAFLYKFFRKLKRPCVN